MRQVLYPKYLLGGLLQRGGGMGGAERAEGDSLSGGGLNGLVGRWPDADTVLQSGMSEGLRDWDLWYVFPSTFVLTEANTHTGVPSFSACCSVSYSRAAHKTNKSL